MRARAKATKQHDDEPHLLLGAAAMLLQTTIGTVRRLAVEGKIASSLDPIGRRVIKLSDIESELAELGGFAGCESAK